MRIKMANVSAIHVISLLVVYTIASDSALKGESFPAEKVYSFCAENIGGTPRPDVFVLNNKRLAIVFMKDDADRVTLDNVYDLERRRALLVPGVARLWQVRFHQRNGVRAFARFSGG